MVGENDSSGLSGLSDVFGYGLPGYFKEPGKYNGIQTHAAMVQGLGMKWDRGQLHPEFAFPPYALKWEGYLDNYFDESSASLFANARHAANKKIGMVSIYRANRLPFEAGEGRDGETQPPRSLSFGSGVRSLNIFELTQLV